MHAKWIILKIHVFSSTLLYTPIFIKVANFKKMLMQWDTQILTGINELLLL